MLLFCVEIEWKQKIYVLAYIYFNYHNSIYRPYADIATQSFAPAFVSHSCHYMTREHEQDEKETLSLLCELGTERKPSRH